MGSAYLADFIDNSDYELEILIPAAARGELDFRGLQKLCERFRRRGVCSFLLTGDPRPFFVNAMQSASGFAAGLRYVDDALKVTSEAKPMYDAIGGGFWDCAATIAKLSRRTWNSAREYEDDFLFVWFLINRFFLNSSEADCRAIVAAHEKAAEGNDQPHRDVCLALLDGDGERFDDALRQTLQARANRVEGMVTRDAIPEESWSWLRYFSSEGLALVKLAERSSLSIGRDYLHVSEALRRPHTVAFNPDGWQQLRA